MTDTDDIDVREERSEGMTILSPLGEIDLARAPSLRVHLSRALDTTPERLIIDLAEVPYMDSVALEGLVAAAEDLSSRSATLKLVNVSPTCREILELTGQASRFQFFPSVQDAVRSFL